MNTTGILSTLAVCALGLAAAAEDDGFVAARRAAAHRPRVIFNNDGNDARSFPAHREPTPENFLAVRTAPLAGSHVTTLSYCTSWGTFSRFSHHTTVGQLATREELEARDRTRDRRDITLELIEQGTCPLQVIVDFAREHDKEVFWSMRMNDTHDGAHRPDRPYFAFPRIKRERPDLLTGSHDRPPPHGSWTAMNYAHQEVRDMAFSYLEEVCRNYDVDGVELDFFRHGVLFKSVAWGGQASDEEREAMTALIRRIHDMTEEIGRERGRPLLVAVRVPDSVAYCRGMGLDIERWAAEGWVDLFIMTGYFRLNEWDYSVDFGKRHDVPVYAGLSETRVGGGHHAHRKRASRESYRGRALEAWNAGLDGVYIFNVYNAGAPYLSEVGDPALLAGLHRLHFPAVRNRHPAIWLQNGCEYLNRLILTPDDPLLLRPGSNQEVKLWPGPGRDSGRAEQAQVTAHVQMPGISDARHLAVTMNGRPLRHLEQAGQWQRYEVDPAMLRSGANVVNVELAETYDPDTGDEWEMIYEGDHVMEMPGQLPWRRLAAANRTAKEEVRDNALYLADYGTGENEIADFIYPWGIDPQDRIVVEARVKVEHSTAPRAVTVRMSNGRGMEYLTLQEDRIGLYYAGSEYPMHTTGDFHTYRIVLEGNDIRVYVDGRPALDGTGTFTTPADDENHWLKLGWGHNYWNENSLMFGSASGPGTGAAYWEYIAYRSDSPVVRLYDVMLEISRE